MSDNYFGFKKLEEEVKDPTAPVVVVTGGEPQLIRTPETGDKVFLIRDSVAHWITSPEALTGINRGFEDIVEVKRDIFKATTMGVKITPQNAAEYRLPDKVKDPEPVKEAELTATEIATDGAAKTATEAKEEFKVYEPPIVLNTARRDDLISYLVIVENADEETLKKAEKAVSPLKHTDESIEIILVANGTTLEANDYRLNFATKVIVHKEKLPYPQAQEEALRISTASCVVLYDILYVL